MKVAHLSEPAEERVTFRDGLGVREWRDTGAGERVEWFHLAPCFAAVEIPLRDRVARLAKLQHVKFARILSMEPARKGAGPVIVSSHVPGTRFSEVLEMAAHGLVTVEPATAVQITREVIGALAVLHDSRNVTHGALAPERLVLTASGRVVVAEHALAAALDRLNLPRHQLWRDWRIATPPTPGPMRFDVRTDLAQLGLLALAALLGRAIDQEEYPHRLRGLLPLAQDKLARSPLAAIATDLVGWVERLVPVESRRAFTTVKEAQQAFEAFVSARATAMIIAPARVKGLMSAVAALSASTAPAVAAATTDGAAPTAEHAAAIEVASVPPAETAADAADEIDIDALLRLEAELEGDPASLPATAVEPREPITPLSVVPAELDEVSPERVAAAPSAVQDLAPPTLEALEHERADLERQFAALVAAVAPAPSLDDAPAVRLRPETPETVDAPLVDPLVRWSSMPASDLPETPHSREEDLAPAPVSGDDADGSAAPELPAFSFEPLVIAVPEADAPAAALDHVPTEWWREALPWRDEPAAPSVEPAVDMSAVSSEPVIASETLFVEPIVETIVETADGEATSTAAEPFAAVANFAEASEDTDESEAAAVAAASADRGDDSAALEETPVVRLDVDVDASEHAVTPDELAATAIAPEPAEVEAVIPDLVAAIPGDQDAAGEGIDAALDVVADAVLVDAIAVVEVPDVDDMAPGEAEIAAESVAEIAAETVPLVVDEARSNQLSAWQAQPVEMPAVDPVPPQLAVSPEAVDAESEEAETAAVDAVASVEVLTPLELMSTWHAGVVDESPVLGSPTEIDDAPTAVDAEPLVAEVDVAALNASSSRAESSPLEQIEASQAEAMDEPSVIDGSMSVLPVPDEPVVATADAVAAVEPSVIAHAPLDGTAVEDAAANLSDLSVVGDPVSEPVAELPTVEGTSPERDDLEPPARASLFGAFTDLRLQVDEADPTTGEEDVPSMRPTFAFLQADTTAPTTASSLLARHDEVPAVEESSWRTAFEAEGPSAPSCIFDSAVAPADADDIAADLAGSSEVRADVAAAVADVDAPAPSPVSEPLPVSESAAVAAPEPEPATEPAPATTFEVEPELVPEVVIVDGGDDADAFDTLTPELPSTPVDAIAADGDTATSTAVDGVADDDAVAEEEGSEAADHSASAAASATTGGRKKRRRARRKKAHVAVPQVPAGVPAVAVAGVSPLASSPSVIPPVVPDVGPAVSDETPLGGRRSLLEREVPTWTPPADLGAVARAAASRVTAVATPGPLPTNDEWSTETFPSAVVEPRPAAPSSVEASAVAAAATTLPSRQAMPVPVESPRLEETIQAVGMPDLEEFGLSSGRVAVTSMADGMGAPQTATRVHEPRASVTTHAASDDRRGWNWRRLIAASVLIALFNGAAFAAWWWVQPGAAGTLVVQTAQPGVEVLLDGKMLGKTPFKDQVAPGRHKLTLRQGASVREMPVEISLGVVTTQSLDWPAADASARGNLQVSSTPAGAEILVDGKSMGKAPQLLEDLPAGNLEMTLRGDAGTVTVTATVIAGETTPFDVPIFAGWVVVDAPIELNVFLRGARIGANTDGQILLSPGRHQLLAVNEALGFRKPFAVLIEPGEVRRVAVTVPPAPLQVQDEPGSEVFVDGERVGALPGTLRIPLGTHDVLVRRPDQTERRQTVTVRAGETVNM